MKSGWLLVCAGEFPLGWGKLVGDLIKTNMRRDGGGDRKPVPSCRSALAIFLSASTRAPCASQLASGPRYWAGLS